MLPSISTQLLYFLSYLFLFLCLSPYVSSLMTSDKETQYDWLMTTTELDTNLLGYVITKTVHLFVLCWSPFHFFLRPSEELNLLHSKCMEKTVIGHYFCSCFSSIFDPTSLHIHYPSFPLMFIFDNKNTIQLVLLVTKQLVYWATDIPKQSCCGSSST